MSDATVRINAPVGTKAEAYAGTADNPIGIITDESNGLGWKKDGTMYGVQPTYSYNGTTVIRLPLNVSGIVFTDGTAEYTLSVVGGILKLVKTGSATPEQTWGEGI